MLVHPFRFAVYSGGAPSADSWLGAARRVEELGYGALYVVDHLSRQLAPISAMAAAAAVTSRLRIGAYVFANDFRHPLILAREAATLDVLSAGRFELGLGAGWQRSDYRQLGMRYDRPGLRIDRMVEALAVIKRLLSGERVDHEGRFYTLRGARCSPRPVQRPRPPIMLGGGGPRFLRIAAREAEIVSFVPGFSARGLPIIGNATERAFARRVELVRRAAGERLEHLELNVFVADAGLVSGRWPVSGALPALVKGIGVSAGGGSPYVMYGTVGQLGERLLRRREQLGVSSYAIPHSAMEAMAPLVERLAGR